MYEMSSDDRRIVYSEIPVKEIWSRLGYFEIEHNAKEFLKNNNKELAEEDLVTTAKRLAFTMQAAREYYESAALVSLLTKPLLVFYGMGALSKVLFMATYSKKSPSKGHGLETPNQKDFEEDFSKLSTKVKRDGTFPQFHSCYSTEKLTNMIFNLKELLSVVCEIKVEYETVYHEKSRAINVRKDDFGLRLVDTELDKYELVKELPKYFPFGEKSQRFKNSVRIGIAEKLTTIRALTGEEYLILPLRKHDKVLLLPEMSIHFLIMYLLGMVSRYYPKEWGEIIEGKTSGEPYIIRKFLEIAIRKFPNLVLNSLWNRNFIFVSPQLDGEKQLSNAELRRICDYVKEDFTDSMRGY